MADSIRMMDLAPLGRPLDQLRALDPEHKAMADRQAFRAAIKHVEQAHQDVPESNATEETRVDEHTTGDNPRKRKGHAPEQARAGESHAAEPVPEIDEGHLLDIKV
jgi:hypothetical protein